MDGSLRELFERFGRPRRPTPTARDAELLARGEPIAAGSGWAATAWGEGPPVLLAHGWNGRRTHWGLQIAALNAAGFRAVAADAPAHGDSPGERAHVLQYGRALVAVGREIGPLAGVVGHSFGAGAAAIALGLGLAADRAVLISGPASLLAVVERWARHHKLAEDLIPRFVALVEGEVGEPLGNIDVARIAAGLRMPALIVHDRGDTGMPIGDAVAVAAAWPGARTLFTEKYGHSRILVARDVTRAIVDFLRPAPPCPVTEEPRW